MGTLLDETITKLADNDAAYFAYKAISATQVKTFEIDGSYGFWKNSPFNPEKAPEVETDAMVFGKYCHCKLFEPAEVDNRFLVMDWGTKTRGTAKYKKAADENPDKILVSPDESERADKMITALKAHKVAAEYLDGCECEKPFIWLDPHTGLECKAKLDGFKKVGDKFVIIDYKTSSDIDGVLGKGEKYEYPMQAEFYKRAIRSRYGKDAEVDFVFIIQSNKDDEADKIAVAVVESETAKLAEKLVDKDMGLIADLLTEYDISSDKEVFNPYKELMQIKYSNYFLNNG